MKVLFIIQGEGRGHLTQALTMQNILRNHGHEVVEALVGKSNARQLPKFFIQGMSVPIKQFESPNFLPTAANKRNNLPRSVAYNVLRLPYFAKSVLFLHRRIMESGADLVINFYELLTGFTYLLFKPGVPQVSIGHQYLFLHKDFTLPRSQPVSLFLLRLFTRWTAMGATERLALSFREMENDEKARIHVVPPLLRSEVRELKPYTGNYLHGYMVNAGYGKSIMQWHQLHPETPLNIFWDKKDAAETTHVDDTLTFHQLSDSAFLQSLAGSKGYATTAGFESVCEAMYLGKPVMMVPAHIEQDCNAYDASLSGAGVIAKDFDLSLLNEFTASFQPDKHFRDWADRCPQMIVSRIEYASKMSVNHRALLSALLAWGMGKYYNSSFSHIINKAFR